MENLILDSNESFERFRKITDPEEEIYFINVKKVGEIIVKEDVDVLKRVIFDCGDSKIIIEGAKFGKLECNKHRKLVIKNNTEIKDLQIYGSIEIEDAKIDLIYIGSSTRTIIRRLKGAEEVVINDSYSSVNIEYSQILGLRFHHCSFNTDSKIHIQDIKYFYTDDCNFCELDKNSFIFSLKCIKNSQFISIQSDFSNTFFIDCDFASTNLAAIRSDFRSIQSEDVIWFKKITYKKPVTHIGPKYYPYFKEHKEFEGEIKYPRESPIQLKKAMLEQDNVIDANYFKSKELCAHYRELNWIRNFNSKFTLGFSYITNRFEQSWLLPTGWILFGGFVFYAWYICSTELSMNVLFTKDFFGKFWVFLNPLHQFDFLETKEEVRTGYSYFVETLHRIFNTFFIYQFIAAFRKFRKV